VDVTTKTVANNDYHHLTNYLEVDFKDLQKPNAPDLYPEELREEIDSLNWWLFDNVNNGVYRAQFARSISAYDEAIESFYAALEQLDQRLADRRFLLGDYVTDSDVRLYTTLARLDIAYAQNLGPLPKRLVDFPNLWPYARDLYQIPAFKHNTYFRDFGRPQGRTVGGDFTSYYARFIDEIDFEGLWGAAPGRAKLSGDPANKFKI
jgi:putative glutathione S-transferase